MVPACLDMVTKADTSMRMASSALFAHLPLPGSPAAVLPPFIYGTAWKKDATASLVTKALQNGFTAIDTASQPKHYREGLVGRGVRDFLANPSLNIAKLKRSDLYLQTKFTAIHGQDPNNIPYNPASSLTEQVQQSVETSLKSFTISPQEEPYLDAVVLHSPMPTMTETLEVWTALEAFVPEKIRRLGISNTNLHTLMELYECTRVKPSVVQNRFYPATKHDIAVRKFCTEKGMLYQSFWTLTGNPGLLAKPAVRDATEQLNVSPMNALYCLVLGLGNTTILNGTTSTQHMKEDWDGVHKAKEYATANDKEWAKLMTAFRTTIGERDL